MECTRAACLHRASIFHRRQCSRLGTGRATVYVGVVHVLGAANAQVNKAHGVRWSMGRTTAVTKGEGGRFCRIVNPAALWFLLDSSPKVEYSRQSAEDKR
eukprot:NODE_468_length_1466_cov_304.007468_g291_i1.p1 GENE.NODE_468_length_1466_cov_304.007468_g291_i1~~NODE_468_length_1466_cov_304.007468_g291_i1.p1  ORF type:complete len:100 (-),score=6.74 NODE_468_length_1466_cov_304.007468_g291_i1:229-528(-)